MEKYVDKNGLLHALQGVKSQLEKYRQSIYDTKGTANGIASLDENGNVPLSQLGNVDTVLFEIVQSLPTSIVEKQKSHIFIVPRSSSEGSTNNYYKEYVYVGKDITKVASTDWEELGEFTSEVDLKNYSKKNETIKSIEFVSSGTDRNLKFTLADGSSTTIEIPVVKGNIQNGLMTASDKAKLDKIDTDALSSAINNANTAATGAEKVNATLSSDYTFTVTDRNGASNSLEMGNLVDAGARLDHIDETLGPYTERANITLTPIATNYVIDANGAKVYKSGWAMAQFTAEKGNVYLFKPGNTDSNVSVFAEAISSVETRGIDYTYTYNDDGTIATAVATYGGKTHTYTYTWTDGIATIKEGSTIVSELPMTYTTTVGSYSPLVRLNADAELPKDGYCRYMSHFKGNSSIKVVVSYKVGSADLTMKVTRDGVLASISTQLGNLSQKEDETRKKVASIQHQIEVSNAFVGFTRENGAVSPDAKSTYGSKSLIHEIGKHFRMATVKNGKIQHYLVGGRITKAVNGDDVAIDGTDGDVLLVCDTNINLLKATCDVDGVETNCLGLGLSPCYWHDKASKQLPKFGISPVDTVNCKLDDDYRSCAHSIYNTDMAGSHSAPQGLFVKSYKTDGKGYSSQWISAVESIRQAQNKNEDALTNRPYIGLYYEFYESLIALMFTEIGSVNAGSNTSFGIGVTCSEQPTASTFVGDQLYANSGFQITLADGTNVYYNAMPNRAVTIDGTSKGNWYLNNSISSESYSQIQVLEGQRVLDGIAKNGWESKMNTNDNIFYFDEDGNLCLTTSTDVNLSTGEGMTECTRYYVARDVPNCEGMSDGVMTAVVNIYTKMTFVDSCTFDSKDVSNCTCIAKQSVPVYRGFALPLTGHFRQLYGMNLVYEVSTENVLTEKFKFAENVQDIPALTVFNNTAYEAAFGTDTPMEKGLTQEYTLPFTNGQTWVSKDNYSLSLFAATECKSASRTTKESRYFWYNGGNAGAGKKQVHASVVGCYSGDAFASVRTLNANNHAGVGYAYYAGAFAVLFED